MSGFRVRPASQADRPLAAVAGFGAFSTFVLAAAMAPFGSALATLAPACPFHVLTGYPCLTCGSTRAVLALLRGEIGTALAWNPLVTLGLLGLVWMGMLAPLWVLVAGPVPAAGTLARSRWLRYAGFLAIALNWGYLLWQGR